MHTILVTILLESSSLRLLKATTTNYDKALVRFFEQAPMPMFVELCKCVFWWHRKKTVNALWLCFDVRGLVFIVLLVKKRSKNQVWCKWHSIANVFQPCRDFITSLNFRSTRASRTMWTWTWWNVCCSLGLDLWRTEQMRKAVFLTSHGTTESPAGWILLGELVGCWNSLLLIYCNKWQLELVLHPSRLTQGIWLLWLQDDFLSWMIQKATQSQFASQTERTFSAELRPRMTSNRTLVLIYKQQIDKIPQISPILTISPSLHHPSNSRFAWSFRGTLCCCKRRATSCQSMLPVCIWAALVFLW